MHRDETVDRTYQHLEHFDINTQFTVDTPVSGEAVDVWQNLKTKIQFIQHCAKVSTHSTFL